jgi:hypothetical protein
MVLGRAVVLDHGHALDTCEGDDVGHALLQPVPYFFEINLLGAEAHSLCTHACGLGKIKPCTHKLACEEHAPQERAAFQIFQTININKLKMIEETTCRRRFQLATRNKEPTERGANHTYREGASISARLASDVFSLRRVKSEKIKWFHK